MNPIQMIRLNFQKRTAIMVLTALLISSGATCADTPAQTNVVLNKSASAYPGQVTPTEGVIVRPYLPARAVDGDSTSTSSRWYSAGADGSRGIQIGLNGLYTVSAWKVQCFTGQAGDGIARDFRLEGTRDGAQWQTIDTVSGNKDAAVARNFSPVEVSQVRLVITYGNQSNNLWTSIQELEVMGYPSTVLPEDPSKAEKTITAAELMGMIQGNKESYTVTTALANITFPKEALASLAKQAIEGAKITISAVDSSMLSPESRQAIGDRPVLDFTVKSGDKGIVSLDGKAVLSIPYKIKHEEETDAVVVCAVTAQGKLEAVRNGIYDPATGMISFKTDQLSRYALVYRKVRFADISADAWYSKAVTYVAAREIASGVGNAAYSPTAKLTRGQFLVMVMKAYGIDPDENPKDNFVDAGNTYYTGYLAAAKRMALTSGAGGNRYLPEKEITRQEMFTLLYNTLKAMKTLPKAEIDKGLSAFNDSNQIAAWAIEPMTYLLKAGVITGSNNALLPTATTDRAQMAQVIYGLLKK